MQEEADLTKSQLLMWTGHQLWPDHAVHNVVFAFHIEGAVERGRFEQAFSRTMAHTDVLRTVVKIVDGVPRQCVLGSLPFSLEYVDLSGEADPQAVCQHWVRSRATRRLDVSRQSFDTVLLKLGEERFVWYLCQHHMFTDGIATTILFGRVARQYAGIPEDIDEYPRFSEYVNYERQYRQSTQYVKAGGYWQKKIAQRCPPLGFYGSLPRTLGAKPLQERVRVDLGRERFARILHLAGQPLLRSISENLSIFSLFAAVMYAYLYRVSGNDRIAIGVASHNRVGRKFANTVGLFVEQDPYHVTIEPADTFASLARKVQRESFDVMRHVPYAPGNPGGQVYDAGLNYITTSFDTFSGMRVRPVWIHPGVGEAGFVLHVHDYEGAGTFHAEFDFNCEVFEPGCRERAVRHMLKLLDACLENPEKLIRNVDILDHEEFRAIIDGRAGVEDASLCTGSFLEWIAEHVRTRPDAIAVEDSDHRWTYAELWAYAERISSGIHQRGIAAGQLIVVRLARSAPMLGALLGIVRSGAVYIALPLRELEEQLLCVFEHSDAVLVIGTGQQADLYGVPVVTCERLAATEPMLPTLAGPATDDPAFVAYTLKDAELRCVETTHGALRNVLGSLREQLGVSVDDALLVASEPFSPVCTLELLLPLCAGARVILAPAGSAISGHDLAKFLESSGVTFMHVQSAAVRLLVQAGWQGGLRQLLCSGDPMPEELVRALGTMVGEVWMLYGRVEAAICSVAQRIAVGRTALIDRPIANTRLYVLDHYGKPVPDGVTGEIWISGAGVADGYRGVPENSAGRFRPDPFKIGRRMCRTGYRGFWRAGQLEIETACRGISDGPRGHAVDLYGFVRDLIERGASLRVEAGRLACRPPRGGLSQDEIALLREYRDDLVAILASRE